MSFDLLNALAGPSSQIFRRWIDDRATEPKIAWYPSCGDDFRDIVYLSSAFARSYPATAPEPMPPDLFIHTDYVSSTGRRFIAAGDDLYMGRDSRLSVTECEDLQVLDLPPLSGKTARFPEAAERLGRVRFMTVSFMTPTFGTITAPLLYVCAENAAFCQSILLRHRPLVSHIVQVRYGHGFGGASCGPAWLLNVIPRLRTQVLVSDGQHTNIDTFRLQKLFNEFPDLEGPCSTEGLQSIRTLPSAKWSNHGDIHWLTTPVFAR